MNHPSTTHQSFPQANAGLTPCDIENMHRQARALAPVLRRQAVQQFWAAVGKGLAQTAKKLASRRNYKLPPASPRTL